MCGICGFYEYKSHKPASEEVLGDMLRVLHHRGPDDSGAHFDNELWQRIFMDSPARQERAQPSLTAQLA